MGIMKEIKIEKIRNILLIVGACMVLVPILKFVFWLNFWVGIIVLGLVLFGIGILIEEGDN